MAHSTRKRTGFVTFTEAPITERNLGAVLLTRDTDGVIHAYEKDFGNAGLDPHLVAALITSAEIRNL